MIGEWPVKVELIPVMKEGAAMRTQVFNYQSLADAAELLREGELVAFPTETVFGLGAIANNEQAVTSVFNAKGRPADNPLIVHVARIEDVAQYVAEVSPLAQALMERFWPGPLTIIFPLKPGVFAESVTPGQQTVAIRMPRQLETLLLIEMVGFPLVGPSANLSGKPSPTLASHVLHDFGGEIAGVVERRDETVAIDIGVESTVVYPQDGQITILRPGAVTASMLAELGVAVEELNASQQLSQTDLHSPGVKYLHYSPNQPVYLIGAEHSLEDWTKHLSEFDQKIGLLADDQLIAHCQSVATIHSNFSLGLAGDIESATRQLYAGLRFLEQSGCDIILAQGFYEKDLSHAYMNRLTKASNYMI